MKLARVGLIAAAILAVAMAAWAQKPDFSGTWTLEPSSAPAGGGDEGGGGSALGNGPATVHQTAEALTIRRTIGGDTVTLTYQLDGTGSRNTLEGGDGRPVDSLSIVKWDGPKLTIVTKQESDGKLAEATQVWTVAGNTLTVETASGRGTQKRIYRSSAAMPRLGPTALALLLVTSVGSSQSPDAIRTAGDPIVVQPIAHGTLTLAYGRHVVLIDPARFMPSYPEAPREDLQDLAKAYLAKFGAPPKPPASSDEEPNPELLVSALPIRPEQMARFRRISPTIILVTHTHTDHLDPRAIAALRLPQTRIIIPTAARGMLLDVQGAETMANGDRITIDDLTIEAVPMYNPKPDPQHGAIFHPKGRGNGYVVTFGGTRVYIGGDTGCTPEMQALTDVELAFVPMNLPYTMSPDEAAACVKAMKPRVVYPYHFVGSDPKTFGAALKGTGIEVRLRDWYSAGR